MSDMSYHRPASVVEAARLAAGDADARILAGGQSILPSMRLGLLTPAALIDLSASSRESAATAAPSRSAP